MDRSIMLIEINNDMNNNLRDDEHQEVFDDEVKIQLNLKN